MSLFFRPQKGVCADFIPFYENGTYYLFYLHSLQDQYNGWVNGVPWCLVETKDFVNYEDKGVMLPIGSKVDHYLFNFTGSVIKKDDTYHIFYTGHNPLMVEQFGYLECIIHATSKDLHNWTRDELFKSTYPKGYKKYDWRDPYVFWNEEFNEYWMLTCTIEDNNKPWFNAGVTGLMTSPDLENWTLQDPLYVPNMYHSLECPDMFKIGDWWYLIFSDTSYRRTRYVMSKSSKGPWITPYNDTFDGNVYYAAKTASDGDKRYLFGWLTFRTKENGRDEANLGNLQWGGNLLVHEIVQNEDGTLRVKLPDTINEKFTEKLPIEEKEILNGTNSIKKIFSIPNKNPYMLNLDINLKEAYEFGVMVGFADFDFNFNFKIDPVHNRVYTIYRDRILNEIWTKIDFSKDINVKFLFEDECFVMYVNNEVALCERIYSEDGKYREIAINKNRNVQINKMELLRKG